MRPSRVVAVVVIFGLVVGSLAGAFLLSSSDPGDDPAAALQAAAAATNAAPSVRTTTHLDGDLVTVEDFVAPHQLHQTRPPLLPGASRMDVVVIGREAFVKARCTKLDPPVMRWRRSTTAAPVTGATNLRVATMLVDSATKVRRVERDDGLSVYRFTPDLTIDDTSGIVYRRAEAVVDDGRLQSLSFVAEYPQVTGSATMRRAGQIEFARYGSVPTISAPPDSETIAADAPCDGLAIYVEPGPND